MFEHWQSFALLYAKLARDNLPWCILENKFVNPLLFSHNPETNLPAENVVILEFASNEQTLFFLLFL